MNKVSLKAFIFWLLAGCLLVSCSANLSPAPVRLAAPTPQPTSLPDVSPTETFFVDAWVDNPAPAAADKVILFGMLNMNGVFLSGIMMEANWPDEHNLPGMPNCYIQLSYGRGVCIIDAAKYPSGKYVPIQIKFDFHGRTLTGQTGFTPR